MIKSFIFDMDGVLVNSEIMYFERRIKYFNQINVTPDSTKIDDYLGVSNQRVWELLVNDPDKRQKIHHNYAEFEQNNPLDFAPYLNDDVDKFLALLKSKNKNIYLASAGPKTNIMQMLKECNIEKYFDQIFSGEEVKHNKPAPDVYLQVLKDTGSKKEECIVVEDSKFGIQAAKTAGIMTWALKPKEYSIDQGQADKIFDDFNQMISEISKLN